MSRTSFIRRVFATRFSTFSLFTATLLSFGLLDEVVSGLPVIGLPLVRDQLRLNYVQIGLLFTISQSATMLLEPLINLLSDRGSKRLWISGGLFGMALSFFLAGSAVSYSVLLLAFVLSGIAGKAAIGLGQGALIDQNPLEGAWVMTRWTLLSGIGDLLAPLTVGIFAGLHLGWSALCWLASTIWFGLALVVAPQSFPSPQQPIEEEPVEQKENR
jgi:FSR family fosmidomycin resistance protein-like MFS transporter